MTSRLPLVCSLSARADIRPQRREDGFGVQSHPPSLQQEQAGTVSSRHPLSSSKPSEVMTAITSRFEGRQDELNADVTHYNIAKGVNGGGNVGSPDM